MKFPDFQVFRFFQVVQGLKGSKLQSPGTSVITSYKRHRSQLTISLTKRYYRPYGMNRIIRSSFHITYTAIRSIRNTKGQFPQSTNSQPIHQPQRVHIKDVRRACSFAPNSPPILVRHVSHQAVSTGMHTVVLLLTIRRHVLVVRCSIMVTYSVNGTNQHSNGKATMFMQYHDRPTIKDQRWFTCIEFMVFVVTLTGTFHRANIMSRRRTAILQPAGNKVVPLQSFSVNGFYQATVPLCKEHRSGTNTTLLVIKGLAMQGHKVTILIRMQSGRQF